MHQFLAALLAVLLWPSVVAAQWPAVNTDIAKGLATVFGTGTAHTYYAQGYGTCTWTVAGDIGPCTNTAIAAAVAAGGGTVVVPAGILGLATTITVPSNVVLLGAGGGGNFLSCGTTLKWNGATSPTATMVSLGSDAAFANGTGFADLCLDGDLKAGIALKALSLMKGYIGRIFIYNPTAHGMLFDISPNSGGTPEQGSFAYSSIEDVLITINSGAANGLTIAKNNVTNSDVHENWFKNIRINATNGYAFECYGADTNTFSQFRFYANPGVSYTPPGGSAASIGSIMHAGDYAGDAYATPGPGVNKLKNWCRRNMFHDVVFGLLQMGRLRMETGRNPSSAIIDGWKAGDGEPFPIVDDGTTARVTGNVTAGSAVVTGMSSTGGLLPGMLVYAPPGLVGTTQPGPGQILKLLTTIASVDSASQVTLTIPAYASATGLALTFEMRDAQIYGGLETTGVAIPGHAAFIKNRTSPPIQVDISGSKTLNLTHCGTVFNNKSATAAQTFVLPPAGGSGCRLTFTRWTGFPVTVQTNLREGPNDRINSQADAGGTVFGGSITANRPFAKITVIDEDTGNWVAESVSGGWISDTGVLMSTGGRVWLGSTSTAPYVFTNLPSGIGTFEMQCSGIVPVTDGIDMVVQISADNGATWKNAAGGYTTIASAEHTTATVTRRTTGVNGFLNVGAIDSAAANPFSLTAWFRDLGSATVNKVVDWQSSYNNNTPVYEEARGSVKYTADQAAINAVRVFPQTGGVSAGSCSIEAVIR